jgi:hypothetical protein
VQDRSFILVQSASDSAHLLALSLRSAWSFHATKVKRLIQVVLRMVRAKMKVVSWGRRWRATTLWSLQELPFRLIPWDIVGLTRTPDPIVKSSSKGFQVEDNELSKTRLGFCKTCNIERWFMTFSAWNNKMSGSPVAPEVIHDNYQASAGLHVSALWTWGSSDWLL